MAKPLNVNTSQVSYGELKKIAEKCGFLIFHGNKHDKIKTRENKFISLLPRHSKLDKNIAKSVVEKMNECGAKITFS